MNEIEIINQINRIIPRNKSQLNNCFESDSEIINFDDLQLLVNVDDFSREDMLRENDPYVLGWNLAVGGISDILASGGIPTFYSHAMTVGKDWDKRYIDEFCGGIADVLKQSDVSFIGGDLSKSADWRYTAVVIGKSAGRPVLRKGASAGDSIYISGEIGLGNFDAGLSLESENKDICQLYGSCKNRFSIRLLESEVIRHYASSCIDTSDGVFNALNVIAEINAVGYELKDIPYIKESIQLAVTLSLPKILFFICESGEYELLFTVSPDKEDAFLKTAEEKKLKFHHLGKIKPLSADSKILYEGNRTINLSDLKVRARDYDDRKDYLNSIIQWLKVNS